MNNIIKEIINQKYINKLLNIIFIVIIILYKLFILIANF